MSDFEALALLESRGIGPTLETAAAALGSSLEQWSLLRVHHRPGAGVTGIYAVRYVHGGGRLDAFLCVTTGQVPGHPHRSVRLRGPKDEALLAWSHPHDPMLPGMSWACSAESVGAALFEGRTPNIEAVSYRPLRRAVLHAEGGGTSRFLKVLRRGHAGPLGRRHELLLGSGVPAPQPVESPGEDVLVTEAAEGTPLAAQLMADGARELEPLALVDLLGRFPRAAMDLPARQPWASRVADYARGAEAVLPEEAGRIADLAVRVHRLVAAAPAGPTVPTHGDFYEGNLLVTDGEVTGLLDVDALGPGHLVDDLACFLAHLAVLPSLDERYVHVPLTLERFQEAYENVVDGAALYARAAGVALTLVAGAKLSAPVRAGWSWQEDAYRRLAVAENFLRTAES